MPNLTGRGPLSKCHPILMLVTFYFAMPVELPTKVYKPT